MQSGIEFKHIIITRYFVRFSDSPADVKAISSPNRAWLDDRFEKFRDFCLPSVVGQSNQNFTWQLFFDAKTPDDEVRRVRDLVAPHDNIKVILCEDFGDDVRNPIVAGEIPPGVDWLLTTRLDNDDGLHRDFVKILQEKLTFDSRVFLNFPLGLIFFDQKTFLYRHPSNAFISLLEPVDGLITVFCAQHTAASRFAPIVQLPAVPSFMQVVHAETRSNKPRGVRVNRVLAVDGFEPLLGSRETQPGEGDWDIVFYNMTVALVWALRDRVVSTLRGLHRAVSPER